MASIKLNKVLRDNIVDRIIAHKFEQAGKDLNQRKSDLGVDLYYMRYTDAEQKKMNALPEGWLADGNHIKVRIPGRYHQCYYFHNADRIDISLRMPYDNSWEPEVGHAALDLIEQYEDDKQDHDEKLRSARCDATALLGSVTTVKRAIEIWPAAETFILDAVGVVGQHQKSNAPLPVVMVESLNEKLGLPPQEAA